ncbi:arginine repressor [uncultured Limosilactobacillus sp.]|uniref:arginine repressor n=1 Tax=uncultured Limosilactobacillus sp. TaxID=2837629 RepID=UPI0025F1E048|nr:arginine repressor [uncultured Limosilactobacillus sp.]
MNHRDRRKLLLAIINNHHVSTQEQLLTLLEQEGVIATQATVSRDIHALNIVKVSDQHGKTYYAQLHVDTEDKHQRLYDAIHDSVESCTAVQFMNVIKTTPNSSYATVLAGMLDESDLTEIVGTLAGNDTLITISKTNESALAISRLVHDHMAER